LPFAQLFRCASSFRRCDNGGSQRFACSDIQLKPAHSPGSEIRINQEASQRRCARNLQENDPFFVLEEGCQSLAVCLKLIIAFLQSSGNVMDFKANEGIGMFRACDGGSPNSASSTLALPSNYAREDERPATLQHGLDLMLFIVEVSSVEVWGTRG